MPLIIRPLETNDFPSWLPLWNENNLGHRNEAVTTETWSRLMDENQQVYGLCALKNGEMAGFLHYVLHPTTGALEPACYMQDVFVHPEYRKQGIAHALVHELIKTSEKSDWSRIYWLADEANEAAQALYKNIGVKMNFNLFILPTRKT